MAQITLDIPDAQLPRVIDALCLQYNYDANGGGLTRGQFAKRCVANMVRRVVRLAEVHQAWPGGAEPDPGTVDVT